MRDPIAFFITAGTYGTWLPGDERGWVDYHRGPQPPLLIRELESLARMSEHACRLTLLQRQIVECQIAETCSHRGWQLHAANCRSNHMHIVVTAAQPPKKVRDDLKAWCTRRLRERSDAHRKHWWAERGSIQFIFDEDGLETVVRYVNEAQDRKDRDAMESRRIQEPGSPQRKQGESPQN